MLAHRYDVQAALYQLALHRLLRVRLGAAYRPAQHLGGTLFLFLRGVAGAAAATARPTTNTAVPARNGTAGPRRSAAAPLSRNWRRFKR